MLTSFTSNANPVLMRELRASLRNVRAFALLAVYVAALGAIVVSQFPANQEIPIEAGGGAKGQELFWMFVGAQAFLVVVLFPALAGGALAQERERRTLETLLLTPLTPLQIVWGKAGGVLSLAALLLVSTLPLTSLSFLLGGVSPGELIGAYSVLLGLCLFTASIGLYCSARWTNTTQATIACYLILPFLLGFIAMFSIFGAVMSGLLLLFFALYGVALLWKRWSQSRIAERLGFFWMPLMWLVMLGLIFGLLALMAWSWNLGILFIAVFFGTTYFVLISQWSLLQAAQQIARRPEPAAPLRQRASDWKEGWQRAAGSFGDIPAARGSNQQVVYLPEPRRQPAPTSTFAATVRDATNEPATKSTLAPKSTPIQSRPASNFQPPASTYGVQPFLSDKLNPVFARELRSGLLGRFEYLFRFSYIAVIASELFLLFFAAAQGTSASSDHALFVAWAKLHLALLMIGAAWLGARAIAPEREGQTLSQLLTTPLTALEIVQGKIMAVMVYSLYIFVMGVPLVLLLTALDVISWAAALHFLLAEIVFGACAAAWGMLCSMRFFSVRRAIGSALGGVLFVLIGAPLLLNVVAPARVVASTVLPLQNLERALNATSAPSGVSSLSGFPQLTMLLHYTGLLLYGVLALLLLLWTMRLFSRYVQSV